MMNTGKMNGMKMMITSVQNNKVKQWNKLHSRKGRIKSGFFFIEGFHLIEEVHNSDWEITEIIVQDGIDYPEWCSESPVTMVSENVFKNIASTNTPQGIAAVVKMNQTEMGIGDSVLLVDAIQDPGNLGTIIRTADAAGVESIMLGENTVDMYNDKVIRATQGSLFHLPISHVSIPDEIPRLKKSGFQILASALNGAVPYNEIEIGKKTALIVGNEGAGINDEIIALADSAIKIPIHGKAESLNVSVAAGILMYYIKT